MSPSLLAIALLAPLSAADAATTLKGVILENELSGPPVANAQIIPRSGANRTRSGSDGTFTLKFPKKKPGEVIFLEVKMAGRVLVNDFRGAVTLPRHPEEQPLRIPLCEPRNAEEMRRRLYREMSLKTIDETYRERFKELEDSHRATDAALAKLHLRRDQADAVAQRIADALAKIGLREASHLHREGARLFLDGKIDEAISLLDENNLRQRSPEAKTRMPQGKKDVEEVVQEWLLKGRLLALRFRFDEAEKAHQNAIETFPESFDAVFASACFREALSRHGEALAAYQRSEALARRNYDEPQIATALHHLGTVYWDKGEMDKAREAYLKALKIRRDLARKDPETYPHLATTLTCLGGLRDAQGQRDAADQDLDEAVRIRFERAKENPDAYRPDLAAALNNLGIHYARQNRTDEAHEAYRKAEEEYRALAKSNPDAYLANVALVLSNLGNLWNHQHRADKALKAHEEARDIRRNLVRKNRDRHLPALAATLNNLGMVYRNLDRMDEAHKAYEEGLAACRELAEKDPEAYRSRVAMLLNNLGILHSDQNRMEEARKAYEDGLATYRELAQKSPETYWPYVASTLNNLGCLHRDHNRMDEASKAYEEALKILRELAKQNPETYLADVATTDRNLGILHYVEDRMDEARKALEEALGIFEECAKRNPERFSIEVTRTKKALEALAKPVDPPPADPVGAGTPGRNHGESGGAGQGAAPPEGT